MEKVTFIELKNITNDEVVQHAIIEHADGSFTSMTKSVYDEQQVEHLTEILPN